MMVSVVCLAQLLVFGAAGLDQKHASFVSRAFQSHWQNTTKDAIADAAAQSSVMPSHCKLAVIGAGWGGSYMAWRLAIDDATLLGPSDVCIFEATNRVAGRVFSVHNLPGLGDLTIDVGGYRFIETDLLPAQLVWDALKLPTACYDYNCSAQCEGSNCYVIKDAYGNNAGYATPVETMLGQIEDEGQGQQVFFGKRLTGIFAGPGSQQMKLAFSDSTTVIVDSVFLNIPSTALEGLDKSSLIFTQSTRKVKNNLKKVFHYPGSKVYAYYDDAWWTSKLGFMEGNMQDQTGPIPLAGRYHDGPLKCVVGKTPAGDPVYSGHKVPFGNCSGALEVYYSFGDSFFQQYMTNPLKPLTVFDSDSAKGAKFINELHQSLMKYHTFYFYEKGIDPSTIPKPSLAVISNWLSDAPIAPSCGSFWGSDAAQASIRAPVPNYNIYVADVDYGYSGCWAAGSLIAAEKVLQAEFGLAKPSWLQKAWYDKKVLSISAEPADLVV